MIVNILGRNIVRTGDASQADRFAYSSGAYALFEELEPVLSPPIALAVREWLNDLAGWSGGPVPPPPSLWEHDAAY